MRHRLTVLLALIVSAILVVSAQAETNRVFNEQDNTCLTSEQAERLAKQQHAQGNTATFKVTGNVGKTGAKIVAFALKRIGCVIVDETRPYQYLLADGEGDDLILGRSVLFTRNDKFVAVAQDIHWATDIIFDVEILPLVPMLTWMPGMVIVDIKNLNDIYTAHLETTQPRPWGDIEQRTFDFNVGPDGFSQNIPGCTGLYPEGGTWKLILDGDVTGEGTIPPLECHHLSPVISATMPYALRAHEPLYIHGAGFGDQEGVVEIRRGSLVYHPPITKWGKWLVEVRLPNAQGGDWNLSMYTPYEGDLMFQSNVTIVQIHQTFWMYLPTIKNGIHRSR